MVQDLTSILDRLDWHMFMLTDRTKDCNPHTISSKSAIYLCELFEGQRIKIVPLTCENVESNVYGGGLSLSHE